MTKLYQSLYSPSLYDVIRSDVELLDDGLDLSTGAIVGIATGTVFLILLLLVFVLVVVMVMLGRRSRVKGTVDSSK